MAANKIVQKKLETNQCFIFPAQSLASPDEAIKFSHGKTAFYFYVMKNFRLETGRS